MRLNFSPALQINNAFQSYQINRSAANKPGVNEAAGSNEERRDTFTLSPAGKTQNLINSLMKQKMDITDRKNALMASVKEQGGSMDSIKTQLEAYDEQLQNIDIQISEAMSRELEKQEEEKKAGDEEPKTKEEILTERMNAVTSMSTDAERIDSLDSIKTRVDGRVKVLESELALDEGRMGDTEYRGVLNYKREKITELKKKSLEISADMNSRMADLAKEVAEERREDPIEEPDAAEAEGSGTDASDMTEE